MVNVWIPVDDFEDNIALDIFKGAHRAHVNKDATIGKKWEKETWDQHKYCSEFQAVRSRVRRGEFEKQRIDVRPGDVVFFSGLTYHEAKRVCGCELLTCRRISLRYVDSEVTRWRNDIPPIEFPIVKMFENRGKLVNTTLPIVYDRNNHVNYNGFDVDGPILPSINQWLRYAWHVIKNGYHQNHLLFRCPHHFVDQFLI